MSRQRLQPTPLQARLPGGGGAGVAAVAARLDALERFVRAAEPYLPVERLAEAHQVLARANQRLALSHQHTVVALAGATGGGKSSLFNALAGRELAPVGVDRPTTGEAYAGVWGRVEDAADLLDWLKVAPAHRFARESALEGADEAGMRGLVLLDLPDFDSLDTGHAAEVKRLLGLVDMVIWVVDPQKYADRVIHEQHLPGYRHHRDVALVALNQADLLTVADLDRLLDDLRRLLAEGGLDGMLTIATSAVDAPAGLAQLRARLQEAVGGGTMMAGRLGADLARVTADLGPLVGPPVAEEMVERAAGRELADGLARVAGTTAAAEMVEATYRRRGSAMTGWVPLQWVARLRGDPLRRTFTGAGPAPAVPDGRVGGQQQPAAALVVREVAQQAATGLPEPWPDAVTAAARSHLDGLPGALDAALVAVDLEDTRTPLWWRVAAAAQWLAAAAAVVGLGWVAVGALVGAFGQPWSPPQAGGLPLPVLLLTGGVAAGVLLALLAQPILRRAARLTRLRVAERLRTAAAAIGREYVISPIRTVLEAYTRARESLAAARGAE